MSLEMTFFSPFKMRYLTLLLILCAWQASAAEISVLAVSSLNFGEAPQGDSSKSVSPGSSETASNASFSVSGSPGTAYTIGLPIEAEMITGSGGAYQSIRISSFKSNPGEGANGYLDSNGSQTLYVGATRDPISSAQVAGQYSGSFMITVIY